MKKTLILLTLIILTIIPINSAATDFAFNRLYQDKQPTSGLNDLNDVSIINPFGQQVILYNQTSGDWYNSYINDSAHHVNTSDYWITDIGSLSTVNATQFSNNGGVLTAIKSWWDGLYCELTGCTMSGDINMDGNNITNINLLKFDTTICTDTDTLVEGDVCWNEDDHTLNIVTGLNGNVIQVGQEVIGIGINKEGVNLPDGTIVSTSSFQGDRMTFIRADGSNVSKSAMIGILTHDCLNNQECAVTVFGSVRDINTTLFTSGNKLYINQSSPGILTNVIPQLPNNPIWVATAMVIHEQVGTIFVNPSIDPGDGFLINNIWATGDITIQGDLDMTNGSIFNLWELVSTDGSRIATGTNPAYSLFSGLDSAEVFSNNQTVGAGVITHALLSTDLGNEKVIAAWQSGKNNSGAYTRNSMGVFPDLGILNVSILTNIEKMWLNFGIRPLANYFSLENKTSVAALWAFESQKLFLHDDLGNGQLLGEGDFTWVSRDGTDIDLYNGDGVHIKKDVIKQFGFSIGDNITSLNADFDSGVLLPFIQTTGGGIADWLLVSSILCHNQECASSLGGSGSPLRSMQSNFSTIDQNNLNLSWWLTINQAPSDIFTVEVNNNIGSGDVTIFSSSSIFTDEFQSIILPSSMNNVSIVTVIFNFRGNNRIVDVVYVDEILIIGNATTTTFANVTVEDALLSFGDKTCGIELSVEDGYQDLNITCDRINLIGNVTAIDVTEVSINVTNNINIGGNLSIDSLTKGSVLFSGDNGLVTEDNSNLFWDNVNNRLGIGKIPTSHTLDLSQNEDDSGILVRGFDDQSQANLGFSITATGFAKMFSNRNFQLQSRDDMTLKSTEGNIIFAIPSGKQAKWLDSSFQPFMTADETTGNVGIGTSTPQNKLDVSGSQVIGTSYAGVNTAPTNGLLVEGNVGIGTASPSSTIHLYEDDDKTGTNAGLTIEQDGTGDAILQFLLTTEKRWVIGIDNDDENKFKITRDGNLNTNGFLIIDNDGNVGIGTTSPSYKLEVNGTINAEIILAQNGFTGNCINTSFVSGIAVGCND